MTEEGMAVESSTAHNTVAGQSLSLLEVVYLQQPVNIGTLLSLTPNGNKVVSPMLFNFLSLHHFSSDEHIFLSFHLKWHFNEWKMRMFQNFLKRRRPTQRQAKLNSHLGLKLNFIVVPLVLRIFKISVVVVNQI